MDRIALFGGSFNPPHIGHREVNLMLANRGYQVVNIPCGPRPDKPSTNDTDPLHRAAMNDIAFGRIPGVAVELFDLERATFTRAHELEAMFAPKGEVWHVVGTDLIRGGARGASFIQKEWARGRDLWASSRFIVAVREGDPLDPRDLPPHHELFRPHYGPSSEEVRKRVFAGSSIEAEVLPDVREYIYRHGLYRGRTGTQDVLYAITRPRLHLLPDPRNQEAEEIAERLQEWADVDDPNLIVSIGGDGWLLKAIRARWRRRVPFFGINAGHKGYLLNDVKDELGAELFTRSPLKIRHSPLLFVEAVLVDGSTKETYAFNDAYVQVEIGKTGWIEVLVNGEVKIPKLVGDGALVATAAGSTAYARSMGAHPLKIGSRHLVLVASNAAEPLRWPGANLPITSKICFRNADPTGWRKLIGLADGVVLGEVRELRIRSSRAAAAEVAYTDDYDLDAKLVKSQFPASGA